MCLWKEVTSNFGLTVIRAQSLTCASSWELREVSRQINRSPVLYSDKYIWICSMTAKSQITSECANFWERHRRRVIFHCLPLTKEVICFLWWWISVKAWLLSVLHCGMPISMSYCVFAYERRVENDWSVLCNCLSVEEVMNGSTLCWFCSASVSHRLLKCLTFSEFVQTRSLYSNITA